MGISPWKDLQLLGRFGIALSVPVVLAAGPLLGYVLGSALDRRWHTSPWVMSLGVILGGSASCIEVYRILRWIGRIERNTPGSS